MNRTIISAMILFLSFIGTDTLYAENKILLTKFEVIRIKDADASRILDELAGLIASSGKSSVVGFSDAKKDLEKAGFETMEPCVTLGSAIEQGAKLGYHQVVMGKIRKSKKSIVVRLNLIDVETRKSVRDIEKEFTGKLDAIVTKGLPILAKGLFEPESSVQGSPEKSSENSVIIRDVYRDKKAQRRNLILGISVGGGTAALIFIGVISAINDGREEKTSNIQFEW